MASPTPLDLDVRIDQAEFARALNEAFLRDHASRPLTLASAVRAAVQDAVEAAIRRSPEYASLESGRLRELFGLADPSSALTSIINAVREGVRVSSAGGTITVDVLPSDLGDVLSAEGASYVSRSLRRGTEILVPWLSWLLLEGSKVIIADWVAVTPHTPSSTRTGGAVMVRPKRPAGGFSVPAEFAGVADDNWLTRAVRDAQPDIEAILSNALQGGP